MRDWPLEKVNFAVGLNLRFCYLESLERLPQIHFLGLCCIKTKVQENYMQLAIQHPGTFGETKENHLAIKKSFSRNAKLCFKRTQRTKPNYLKTSKTQIEEQKASENQSSGTKIENTPALYLTTNNVS